MGKSRGVFQVVKSNIFKAKDHGSPRDITPTHRNVNESMSCEGVER